MHFAQSATIGKLIMHSKFLFLLGALCTTTLLVACKNYSVSVNENVVYTPAPLFKNFKIADTHLRNCVEQTIIDGHITKVEELKQLNCSHAGIDSLAGLEVFSAIEQLNLSENNLVKISELNKLARLRVLMLRKNHLTSAEPLLHLLHLQELDISENRNLACVDVNQLLANFQKGTLKVNLPEQCKAKS